jgi:peptidoglycan/LPS O-acetylase OafA/YrhL
MEPLDIRAGERDAEASVERFWAAKYMPVLDGLRAISVLMVCFNHLPNFPASVPMAGYLGVDVFFVLSGFLISTLLLREREARGAISASAFYARRAFRILPVYFVVLLAYVAAVYVTHDAARQTEMKLALPWLVSFLQEYRPAAAGSFFGQSWSLGIEEKFYLVWPGLVMLLFPFRRPVILVACFMIAAGALIAPFLPVDPSVFMTPEQYVRCYGALGLGACLAAVLARSTGAARERAQFFRLGPNVACLLAIIGYIAVLIWREPVVPLFSVFVTLLTGALVLHDRSRLSRFLGHPIMTFVGRRSYSMYLLHVLTLHAVEVAFQKAGLHLAWYTLIGIGFPLTIAAASLTDWLIEKPMRRRGHALSARLMARN